VQEHQSPRHDVRDLSLGGVVCLFTEAEYITTKLTAIRTTLVNWVPR
jgi:hypothetical protein